MKRSLFGAMSSRGWRPADIINDFGRARRLMLHPRVPLAMKILFPLGALAYWVIPIDLLPILPFDDIAVVLLALRAFVWLGESAARGELGRETFDAEPNPGQVVDTTWRVVDE